MNLCYKVFCEFFGDFWVYLGGDSFLKGLEKFREVRKIEDLMKFKNENLKLIINRRTPS